MKKFILPILLLAMVSSLQSTPSFQRYFVQDICSSVKSALVTRWMFAVRLQGDQSVMVENKKALMSVLAEVARRKVKVQVLVDCTDEHLKDMQKLQAAGVQLRLYPWKIKAIDKACSTPRDIELFSFVQTLTIPDETLKTVNPPSHVFMQTYFHKNGAAQSHGLHGSFPQNDRSYNGSSDDLSKPNKMLKEFEKNWKKAQNL